ncbi:2-isopropylmalate synthase [Pectobacterium brasiliense]|uniref:2-isopropylmalate synthase n=1 Tax=Pectobacterium brasiliense TaxID=180957 RepID=A0A433NHT8_9GAMM|nr:MULTISPECIES: 2-isopropylmalate synthase [Pectobacterium]GKW28340.1 2-isopropylmalate synthase [Pectobacterium carotovorum subsp. carotovorum]MBN3047065.1 2-isopropylmalate synthase [Pectobacterium brasiliense]MBN3074800.1 2-isopropylmalate synthase [Pectobacterium brasiliense]MBN3084073.1 2-isopropylmalate synthase [Pectobacterium brasiliense]MBN3089613.1 2-isopropylmalate synthase [Pectobacterium brasiliense]
MLNNPSSKYKAYPPIGLKDRQWPDKTLTQPPRWLSTDLRDGNQALAEPMNEMRKLKFWDLLIACGFREIEVAFPSASQTDFNFVRLLIEEKRIPQNVTIQVLTQAREDLIARTFESLSGVHRATIHLYNATAPVFREVVFRQTRDEIIQLAVNATKQIRQLCAEAQETDWTFQYSPETFCFTEPDFALQICEAVADVWEPDACRPMIINLPATVEVNTPNVYADQIEYFCRHFSRRDKICISVHPHNDRGTGIACAELALLAGAERVEGCLFGNGERTGNVDLVTLALNLYTQGISPELDFSHMKKVVEVVEECNQLHVAPRHPYAGELAFTAFSGSHQDAIKKGFAARQRSASPLWEIPYLPLDPEDIGCNYEAVIRVNSQSGKSGAAWLLEQNHGLILPRQLQKAFSLLVQKASESEGKEMSQMAVWMLFREAYGLVESPLIRLTKYTCDNQLGQNTTLSADIIFREKRLNLKGAGNGFLSAGMTALCREVKADLNIVSYQEHTLGQRSDSRSVAYVCCQNHAGECAWGVSIDSDVTRASLQAMLNAAGRLIMG